MGLRAMNPTPNEGLIAEVHANMEWIDGTPLKPTPNWDDLGWCGMNREGGGVGAQGAPIAAIAVIARDRRDRERQELYSEGREERRVNLKPTPISTHPRGNHADGTRLG